MQQQELHKTNRSYVNVFLVSLRFVLPILRSFFYECFFRLLSFSLFATLSLLFPTITLLESRQRIDDSQWIDLPYPSPVLHRRSPTRGTTRLPGRPQRDQEKLACK